MSAKIAPRVVTAAQLLEAVKNGDITMSEPVKKGLNKPESFVTFKDGARIILQLGTNEDPIPCPNGMERWAVVGGQGKYEKVVDLQWARNLSLYKKAMTKKEVKVKLVLRQYKESGKEDFHAYEAVDALINAVVGFLTNGVKIGSETKKIWDANVPEDLVRRMLTTPLQRPTEYAPAINVKIRHRIVGENGKTLNISAGENAGVAKLDVEVRDGTAEGPGAGQIAESDAALKLLGAPCTGMWLLSVNPVLIQKNAVNLTFDLVKCKVARFYNVSAGSSLSSAIDFVGATAKGPIHVNQAAAAAVLTNGQHHDEEEEESVEEVVEPAAKAQKI